MSKTRIFALLLIGVILAAILTNPKKEEFESAIATKAKDILQEQLNYEHADAVQLGMALFGDKVVQGFIDSHVVIRNYYLFSTVSIKWQGEETPVGGGAFKTVWFSPEIDRKVDEIIEILKDL
ncbi:MAG TPA: hypothetical protein PKA53_03675 [Sphingobacterium sp.]|nr:hypothetical protein [Sphingobacterium sp.]